ncbi:DUF302 domain-containing protein [Thermosipho ferrireducens]|uniref:DUF302 domain-containing protein n=1 Tax=Thermosipho ferrireducens TaxID=2571116 RepID=A0ABX7S991_9BACT|nr:DUF302 domain-containing protein [Thermosipho ferrireducens]QTA37755.1 DUF302 domain-containing protein [Thermosipho ferrireducens]
MKYAILKETEYGFDEAIAKITDSLKKEGFGILTRIDIDEKFKEKLGIDFKKYAILGACNPQNAYKALTEEETIGLLLPCNIVVYEKGDKTVVAAIKPTAAMMVSDNAKVAEIAKEIEKKLETAVENV